MGYPMPVKGSEEAFAAIAKDDPEIEVSVEDLENGSQFKELSPDERKAWDRVWTEVKA
jgi:spermidine/putrescine transport system substrate-binding protein